jgi:uncharacterized protein YbaR (Trm112 family)
MPGLLLFRARKQKMRTQLLDIIACLKCKGPVRLTETKDGLVCAACQLVYEIQDDIPVMLISEARPLRPR